MWAGQLPLGRAFWEYALIYGTLASVGAGFVLSAERRGTVNAAIGFGVGSLVAAGLVVAVQKIHARVQARRALWRRKVEMRALAGTAAIALLDQDEAPEAE